MVSRRICTLRLASDWTVGRVDAGWHQKCVLADLAWEPQSERLTSSASLISNWAWARVEQHLALSSISSRARRSANGRLLPVLGITQSLLLKP